MLTAFAALTAVLALACGGTTRHETFSFGRVGGSIAPYTVTIAADGSLTTTGPVKLSDPNRTISPARLATLDRLVASTRFFSLPARTLCPGSLPDFAASFVAVTTPSRHRRVLVRGACSPRFQALYRALSAAAGVR